MALGGLPIAVVGAEAGIRRPALLATFAAVALVVATGTLVVYRQRMRKASRWLWPLIVSLGVAVLVFVTWTALAMWGGAEEATRDLVLRTGGLSLEERAVEDEMALVGVGDVASTASEIRVFLVLDDAFYGRDAIAVSAYYRSEEAGIDAGETERWSGASAWLNATAEQLTSDGARVRLDDLLILIRSEVFAADGADFSRSYVVDTKAARLLPEVMTDDIGICLSWNRSLIESGASVSTAAVPSVENLESAVAATVVRRQLAGEQGTEACDRLTAYDGDAQPTVDVERDEGSDLIGLLGLAVGVVLLWTGIRRIEVGRYWKTLLSLLDLGLLIAGTVLLGWLGFAVVAVTNVAALVVNSVYLAMKKDSHLTYASIQAGTSKAQMVDVYDDIYRHKAFRSVGPIEAAQLVSLLAQRARTPSEIRGMAPPIGLLHVVHDVPIDELVEKIDRVMRLYNEPASATMKIADQLTVATKNSAATFREMLDGMLAFADPPEASG